LSDFSPIDFSHTDFPTGVVDLSAFSVIVVAPVIIGIPDLSIELNARSVVVESPVIDIPDFSTIGISTLDARSIVVESPVIDIPVYDFAVYTISLVAGPLTIGIPSLVSYVSISARSLVVRPPTINFAQIGFSRDLAIRLTPIGVVVDRPFIGVPIGPTRDLAAIGVTVGSPTIDVPLLQVGDTINPGILADAGSQLIYRQATGLEKALADVDAYNLTRTYAELVRDQWDPYAINYRNLGYLAWAMGVNLWEADWDETFRRWWVANQWTMKYERGSLLGISDFLNAAGSNSRTCPYGIKVMSAIVPPAKFFPGKSSTAADRAAYLARFPQLRLYPYVARALLSYNCFSGNFPPIDSYPPTKRHNKNGDFLGPLRKFYPTDAGAGGRYTRTAVYWDRGISTKLTLRTIVDVNGTYGATTYDQVTVPARKNNHWFLDQKNKWPLPARHKISQNVFGIFLGSADDTASRQILIPRDGSLNLSLAQAQYQTINTGMTMMNVYPNHISEVHAMSPWSLYLGKTISGVAAKGSINFSVTPTVGSKITIGTQVLTFIPNGMVSIAPHQIALGVNLSTTIDDIVAYLATQRGDPILGKCNYNSIGNSKGNTGITVTSKTIGMDMNSFGLGTTDPAGTVSPMYGGAQPLAAQKNQFLSKKFLPPSKAWQFIYEQWYLFDPSRVPDYRKASVYMGHARLGIQRYTAELKIAAFSNWKPWFVRNNGFLRGHLRPANNDMISKVRRAVTASMALRDTVRIQTKIRRIIDVNDSLPIDGSVKVGQYIDA
jgi:Phage tail protein (Tail_P2_I)